MSDGEGFWNQMLAYVGGIGLGCFLLAGFISIATKSCETDELKQENAALKLALASASANAPAPSAAPSSPSRVDPHEVDRCDMGGGVPVAGHRWGIVCVKSSAVEWRSHYQENP